MKATSLQIFYKMEKSEFCMSIKHYFLREKTVMLYLICMQYSTPLALSFHQ